MDSGMLQLELMDIAYIGWQSNVLRQDAVYSSSKRSSHRLWRWITIEMLNREVGADAVASLEGSNIFANSDDFAR